MRPHTKSEIRTMGRTIRGSIFRHDRRRCLHPGHAPSGHAACPCHSGTKRARAADTAVRGRGRGNARRVPFRSRRGFRGPSDRRTPEPGILRFQFLQPLHLVALQSTVFGSPAIVCNFRHAYRPDRLRHRFSLRTQHVNLTRLRAISSALCLFTAISMPFLGSLAILHEGSLFRGQTNVHAPPLAISVACAARNVSCSALLLSRPSRA